MGMLTKNQTIEAFPDEDRSSFSQTRYKFFLDAPFEISNKCCNVMKKGPAHKYNRETGRKPFIATMAEESALRKQRWLMHGCNGFDMKEPVSNPMSFWLEQDVLKYIKQNNIEIASVYGEITYEDNQMDICEFGLADDVRRLKTTGCKRTGCMYCGFGCHLQDDQRFVMMKETHPKQYDFIMKPKEQGGLGYKEVIDWINEHGNLNIRC